MARACCVISPSTWPAASLDNGYSSSVPAVPRVASSPPLLDAAPATLVIANRSAARAHDLAQRFAGTTVLCACAYPELAGQSFDLVINATSASLAGELPPLPTCVFAPGSLAYDMMYGQDDTPFLAFARGQGAARVADGLGMLVEQAAEAFQLWRGLRPESAPVMRMLRSVAAKVVATR